MLHASVRDSSVATYPVKKSSATLASPPRELDNSRVEISSGCIGWMELIYHLRLECTWGMSLSSRVLICW